MQSLVTGAAGSAFEVHQLSTHLAGGAHQWRAPQLGQLGTCDLAQGSLQYFARGRGRPIVFAHGWLANANLWRHVVDALAERFRCVTLDLPFGSHRVALRPDADLTPRGCGRLIAAALDALELSDATLVGNDSGGAYSQIAAAHPPHRIARLVLNSCKTLFDEFPPEPFTGLPAAARDPAMLRGLLSGLEDRTVRATPPAYGLLAKRPIDDLASDSYALPCLRDPGVLRDASKVISSASTDMVRQAGERLMAEFAGPVLFAWSPEDRVFPFTRAQDYAARLRDARVVAIEDA
jgi:pimeloyl-ACP methyl ester carboxylesterase